MSTLITESHLSKPAYIYVRQSTLGQVRHHQESTERQYALRDKALALGWAQHSVRVLDRDLGQSGAQASGREDFKNLVSDVAMGQVGAVFALEASRLARSNLDWLRLLELCALTHTLVIDADGCYDPGDFNDGLLLGLKGTMAQAELHFLRGRLQGGKLNKARKGELRSSLPVGYLYDDQGRMVFDADDEVRGAVQLVFTLFRETGSAYAVVHRFAQSGLQFPKRDNSGAWAGKLVWGRLSHTRVLELLKNPSYAGVYFYGRSQCVKSVTAAGEVRKDKQEMPRPQWHVYLPDHHEGYVSVEEFEQNKQRLARNRTNGGGTVLNGAAREGSALLQGLLLCGRCGRGLRVRYRGTGGQRPTYECNWARREALTGATCFSVVTSPLDDAVCEEFFKALKPAEMDLALAAVDELERRDFAVMRQWQMRIERAEYDCALAERRYEEVDPANRLVAASLERRWNEAMKRVEDVKCEAAKFQTQNARVLTTDQRAKVIALARDLPRLWRAPTTEKKDRKRMLRLLIADITVEDLQGSRQVALHVRWQGGACSDITVTRPRHIGDVQRYPSAVVDLVRELSRDMTVAQVAQALNARGLRSARGRPFTRSMIEWIRSRHAVAASGLRQPDEVTVKELADELGVSVQFVHYWIGQGAMNARQIGNHGHWWIKTSDELRRTLREHIRNSRHVKDRPLPNLSVRSAL